MVSKAIHKATGETVAIKKIPINFKHEYQTKKVLREIMILRQLSQMKKNVFTVLLYDIYISEEAIETISKLKEVFLVMEFVKYDLRGLLSNETRGYGANHTTVIIYNLLCAMKFLHSANVIHRDLKPANILINDECVVKLCDFGLSCTESLDEHKDKGRSMSPLVQTRWYRSPEVILLDKHYNTKIDMWSMGCMLNELI